MNKELINNGNIILVDVKRMEVAVVVKVVIAEVVQ